MFTKYSLVDLSSPTAIVSDAVNIAVNLAAQAEKQCCVCKNNRPL